jgi:hypothetical protein
MKFDYPLFKTSLFSAYYCYFEYEDAARQLKNKQQKFNEMEKELMNLKKEIKSIQISFDYHEQQLQQKINKMVESYNLQCSKEEDDN